MGQFYGQKDMVITIIECGFLWFVDNLICGSRVCGGGGVGNS